ncbi:hypothetical protein FDO65_21840 [Nakamurella flava]|uniref:Uncharacterized protein n=1 Tax=Nakamurella flava TaxID=2576308 RepID=A0A4V6CR42_9ACTN|nr:hypothetical protein [Nakamurella flava]TKV55985.1 hypothetical protein FDO65_21840 [Nakamurella flava]
MDPDSGRARREFIRRHHPDVGGDPEAFVRGLAAFDPVVRPADVAGDQPRPTVRTGVVARARRRRRLVRRLDALAQRLPGAPVLPGVRRDRRLR